MFAIKPCISSLTIEYTLINHFGSKSDAKATIVKHIPIKTYAKNTITPIISYLPVEYTVDKFYMWDAQKHYFDTNTGNYPMNPSDPRWCNMSSDVATRSAKNCPNVYEACWYAFHGDPHWDPDTPWITDFMGGKPLQQGGMWFKKKQYIPGFSNNSFPTGITQPTPSNNTYNTNIKTGRPTNIEEYFFLPASGYYYSGSHSLQYKLTSYWTKTAVQAKNIAYYLFFSPTKAEIEHCFIGNNASSYGHALWTAQ